MSWARAGFKKKKRNESSCKKNMMSEMVIREDPTFV